METPFDKGNLDPGCTSQWQREDRDRESRLPIDRKSDIDATGGPHDWEKSPQNEWAGTTGIERRDAIQSGMRVIYLSQTVFDKLHPCDMS